MTDVTLTETKIEIAHLAMPKPREPTARTAPVPTVRVVIHFEVRTALNRDGFPLQVTVEGIPDLNEAVTKARQQVGFLGQALAEAAQQRTPLTR